jgi:hypothetical protein
MNLLSYDIEIYNELPEGEVDFSKIIPSVAAICTNENDVQFFYDLPYMTKETANKLVDAMVDYYKKGYPIFGHNTCYFDFQLIGLYADRIEDCAKLALNSIDSMLLVTFNRGFFLGLDTALIGAGLETKTHKVQLNDGTWIEDMSGAKAPEMWRNGEVEAVKTYLKGDVIQPLKLAQKIVENRGIKWISKSGKPMFQMTKLTPVKDLFALPLPDTSWMDSPKPRKDFVKWMPEDVLKKYKIHLDKL